MDSIWRKAVLAQGRQSRQTLLLHDPGPSPGQAAEKQAAAQPTPEGCIAEKSAIQLLNDLLVHRGVRVLEKAIALGALGSRERQVWVGGALGDPGRPATHAATSAGVSLINNITNMMPPAGA